MRRRWQLGCETGECRAARRSPGLERLSSTGPSRYRGRIRVRAAPIASIAEFARAAHRWRCTAVVATRLVRGRARFATECYRGWTGTHAFRGPRQMSGQPASVVERRPLSSVTSVPDATLQHYVVSGEGELYGETAEGKELVGKPLAEHAVEEFEERPEERSRRTPEVMEELEQRRTPEARTDTVYPLLRRAKIVVSGTEMRKEEVTVPESPPVASACPPEVIRAVTDDFDKATAVKEVKK